MKFTLAAATAALVSANWAVLASAYTTPVGDAPSGNPIAKPGLGDIVPKGEPYTITWTPTSSGTVTLILLRGPGENVVPLEPIAENIPNTGTYEWTPGSSLEPDTTRYGIQLIQDSDGVYQYSTQFGIGEASGSSASVTLTPTPSDSISKAVVTGHSSSTTHASHPADTSTTTVTGSSTTTYTSCAICSHNTTVSVSGTSYSHTSVSTTSSTASANTTTHYSSTTAQPTTLRTSTPPSSASSSSSSSGLLPSSSSAPTNASSTSLAPANSAAGQLAVSLGSATMMMAVASFFVAACWI